MDCYITKECTDADAYILPAAAPCERRISLPDAALDQMADHIVRNLSEQGESRDLTALLNGREVTVAGAALGEELTPRKLYLTMAKVLRRCRNNGARRVAIALDNCPSLTANRTFFETIVRLTELVNYENRGVKTTPSSKGFEAVALVTAAGGLEPALEQALSCARGTVSAREFCNQRASAQTPESLARDARALCESCGCEVEILDAAAAASLGMDAFLAVARGAANTPPAVIIMRWLHGGDTPVIGLVGKGVVYDSGGYSLKGNANMRNMFDDMGGGAAVIGAMSAVARSGLPVNAVGIVAACENKISCDAYLPGDIIGSMAGKSIEVTNTDAEGRLTLADALTLAIRREKCDLLVDIATLTGAAKGAVGGFSSAVFSNHDGFFDLLRQAAVHSSEKVWRLDLDPEMRAVLNSPVADLRNGVVNSTSGGGSMVPALFLQEFVEKHPWLHIDMAGVNYRLEPPAFSSSGATGYGAALLYYLVRSLPDNYGSVMK